jgi:hypothetical protein
MEKEFVPYQPSLDMKELGFDEPCFSYYKNDQLSEILEEVINSKMRNVNNEIDDYISAPTFSQAFRWFREKYNLHSEPYTIDMGAIEYCFQIRDLYSEKYVYDNFVGAGGSYHGTFFTPEEAELECLKKLIEIVKEKK